jgi:hypothetical protein
MKKTLFALILACAALPGLLQASFELIRNNSPRGMAMGNAIVGDPDPINGVLYNPALLAFSKQLQWQGIFSLDYLGFDTSSLYNMDSLLVVPFTYKFKYDKVFKNMVAGFSFNRMSVKDTGADYLANDQLQYYEQFFSLSLAKKFENVFAYGTVFSVGFNANLFMKGLTSDANNAVSLNEYFATGNLQPISFGLDLGATYFLNKAMVIGGAIENLIPPNTAFNKALASDKGLMSYKLALSWKMNKILFMKNATIAGALVFGNWESKADIRKPPMEYHLGYEFWEFEKLLGVRLGYEWSRRGAGAGYSHLCAGLACSKLFDVHEIQVDLAYQLPLYFSSANALSGTYGTVKFALTYSWSWPQSLFEFDPQKREELRQIEDLKKQYQQQEQQSQVQEGQLKKDEKAAGGAAAANLTEADGILAKANQDRNARTLDLFNQYTKQKDAIVGSVNKLKDESAKKLAELDKKIAAETNKYAKAKPDELAKAKQAADELKKQKDALLKDTNTQITALNGQLNQLKTDTSVKRKDIEKEYDAVKKKNIKQATENFKEIPPSVNVDEFRRDLGEK